MKVWLGYECTYDFCDIFNKHRSLRKVFDCEEKALLWIDEIEYTDYDWREYEEKEVE